MMKCAIITPTNLLEYYAGLSNNYHLILSHIAEKSSVYKEYYQKVAQKGDFIILDNSAHEFGVGSNIEGLIRLADEIQVSEIVLPDRLFFGDDTLYYAIETFQKVKTSLPQISIMGVPQGRTEKEYFDCMAGLVKLGVDTIGISKDYEVWKGGISEIAYCTNLFYPDVQVHLLGWGRNLLELNSIGRDSSLKIRGIDSAKPLQYAASNIQLLRDTRIRQPEYPRRQLNFFDLQDKDIPMGIAINNIGVFMSWARCEDIRF